MQNRPAGNADPAAVPHDVRGLVQLCELLDQAELFHRIGDGKSEGEELLGDIDTVRIVCGISHRVSDHFAELREIGVLAIGRDNLGNDVPSRHCCIGMFHNRGQTMPQKATSWQGVILTRFRGHDRSHYYRRTSAAHGGRA